MVNVTHWTERSTKDFLYSIASDFIEQLQEQMERIPMKQSELAKLAKVSKGYVSKMFKNPGNLSLETIVKFARIVGMKVSIVGYVDINDPANSRGPISAEVFRRTWENANRPSDMWSIKEKTAVTTANTLNVNDLLKNFELGFEVYLAKPKRKRPQPTSAAHFNLLLNVEQSKATSVGKSFGNRSVTIGE